MFNIKQLKWEKKEKIGNKIIIVIIIETGEMKRNIKEKMDPPSK